MSKMKFHFTAKCSLYLEQKSKKEKPTVQEVRFSLDPSPNLEEEMYVLPDGLLTEHGTKALTQVLVQSLAGNIHQAHQRGIRDSAEHLRYIISQLERAFVAQMEYSLGHSNSDNQNEKL